MVGTTGIGLPPVRPSGNGVVEPALRRVPPLDMRARPASGDEVRDRHVWLVHPWALCGPPEDLPADVLLVSICPAEFHDAWAWNDARWAFVGARMRELAALCWHDSATAILTALRSARSVHGVADPHLDARLREMAGMGAPRRLFAPVERPCASFSRWWKVADAAA